MTNRQSTRELCSKCNGTKFIHYTTEDGYDFSKRCECYYREKNEYQARVSGLGRLLDYRVNQYIADTPTTKAVKDMAIDYVTNNKWNWFTFLGQSGVGKTMICSAIANHYLNDGVAVKYISWTYYISDLKKRLLDDSNAMDDVKKVKVLYIDDFLKGRYTEYDVTLAYELINYRYNNELITLISSERLLDELLTIDEATAGRIVEMTGKYLLQVSKGDGKNYRLR